METAVAVSVISDIRRSKRQLISNKEGRLLEGIMVIEEQLAPLFFLHAALVFGVHFVKAQQKIQQISGPQNR